MGTIINKAIVVTAADYKINDIRDEALRIYGTYSHLISSVCVHAIAGEGSFFIAPDGSKEGWDTSNTCKEYAEEFKHYLGNPATPHCEWFEVHYGGDYGAPRITASSY